MYCLETVLGKLVPIEFVSSQLVLGSNPNPNHTPNPNPEARFLVVKTGLQRARFGGQGNGSVLYGNIKYATNSSITRDKDGQLAMYVGHTFDNECRWAPLNMLE